MIMESLDGNIRHTSNNTKTSKRRSRATSESSAMSLGCTSSAPTPVLERKARLTRTRSSSDGLGKCETPAILFHGASGKY